MSLRLRLSLIFTLLVAIVLTTSGFGLYFLLKRNLNASLDTSLQDAANLLKAFVEDSEGQPQLQQEGENIPQLREDLRAIIFDSNGKLVDYLGRVPEGISLDHTGFYSWQDWRVFATPLSSGTLLTLRQQEASKDSLERFLITYLGLAPLTVLLAFGLGYLFSGQALKPVRKATDATHDLAKRRAYKERLPEPKSKDELFSLVQGSNTLLAALEDIIETERRFTADAAHELRTPITVLQGRLEKALELVTDAKATESLKKALSANETLQALIDKLLMLARTEAGQGLNKEPIALDTLAFEATDFMRSTANTKGLKLEFHKPEMPVIVLADKVTLGLLIRNLLENAIKFTAQGVISVQVRALGNSAELRVEDSGIGIPEEAIPYLFNRFYQVDVRHRRMGSGLGLALVKSIADWHGASITVSNRAEGGSSFSLSFPLSEKSQTVS